MKHRARGRAYRSCVHADDHLAGTERDVADALDTGCAVEFTCYDYGTRVRTAAAWPKEWDTVLLECGERCLTPGGQRQAAEAIEARQQHVIRAARAAAVPYWVVDRLLQETDIRVIRSVAANPSCPEHARAFAAMACGAVA